MTAVYILAILLAFAVAAVGWARLVTVPDMRRSLADAGRALKVSEFARSQELAATNRRRDVMFQQATEIKALEATIASLNETLASTAKLSRGHREQLGITTLVRDVLAQQLADTFALPTIHGHDAEITSPAASVEPAPIYEATEAFVPRIGPDVYRSQVGSGRNG